MQLMRLIRLCKNLLASFLLVLGLIPLLMMLPGLQLAKKCELRFEDSTKRLATAKTVFL